MTHFKLTFSDRDDVHVEAEDMPDATEEHGNFPGSIGVEEIDDAGKILSGIYRRPRNAEEQLDLITKLILELRVPPAENPDRAFLQGKLFGLSMAYLDIYQRARNIEEQYDLFKRAFRECRMQLEEGSNREFVLGKRYGLEMALMADWEPIWRGDTAPWFE